MNSVDQIFLSIINGYRFSLVIIFTYSSLSVEVTGKIKNIGATFPHSALPLSAS
jgi:hypothetical protein